MRRVREFCSKCLAKSVAGYKFLHSDRCEVREVCFKSNEILRRRKNLGNLWCVTLGASNHGTKECRESMGLL